jgi:hypothetical protein
MQNPVHIDFVGVEVTRLIIYDWRYTIYALQSNTNALVNRKSKIANQPESPHVVSYNRVVKLVRCPPPRYDELFTTADEHEDFAGIARTKAVQPGMTKK